MGYVAIGGGERAIAAAAAEAERSRCCQGAEGTPLPVADVQAQLHLLVDRVCGEGGCWDPGHAALAIKQAAGDPLEAAFLVRAHRGRLPRLGVAAVHEAAAGMRLVRRISAAFKEIPGGQVLGPCTDYQHRLFRYDLLDEDGAAFARARAAAVTPDAADPGPIGGSVLAGLRGDGLLSAARPGLPAVDITREPPRHPITRPAWLAHLARGETGGVLALGYSTMRGYGYLHPTVAELRYGHLPVRLPHPLTGELCEAGEVPLTEVEVVAMHGHDDQDEVALRLGYGAAFGHQETKAIAMAMCDLALQAGESSGIRHPAQDPEFVVAHVDGIEAMGFCNHYKLPHYVTFQADLENLRAARRQGPAR